MAALTSGNLAHDWEVTCLISVDHLGNSRAKYICGLSKFRDFVDGGFAKTEITRDFAH